MPLVQVVRVGDVDGPPLGTSDPELLIWAEENEFVLVSNDKQTPPGHLQLHLEAGRHSPGILFIRPGTGLAEVIAALDLISGAGDPEEYRDCYHFIPL